MPHSWSPPPHVPPPYAPSARAAFPTPQASQHPTSPPAPQPPARESDHALRLRRYSVTGLLVIFTLTGCACVFGAVGVLGGARLLGMASARGVQIGQASYPLALLCALGVWLADGDGYLSARGLVPLFARSSGAGRAALTLLALVLAYPLLALYCWRLLTRPDDGEAVAHPHPLLAWLNNYAAAAVTGIVVVCFAGVLALAQAAPSSPPPSSSSSPEALMPATGAAAGGGKLHATSVPARADLSADAVLGGTEPVFLRYYGPETFHQTDVRHYQAKLHGMDVLIVIALDAGIGGDRVGFLHLNPPDMNTHWDAVTAIAIGKTFLPADATFVADRDVPDFGTEHVYHSAALSAAFPATAFTDATSGAAVAPGTFYYACGDANEAEGGCTLQLGQ